MTLFFAFGSLKGKPKTGQSNWHQFDVAGIDQMENAAIEVVEELLKKELDKESFNQWRKRLPFLQVIQIIAITVDKDLPEHV